MGTIDPQFAQWGRQGGSSKSAKKQRASRENGKKGGAPVRKKIIEKKGEVKP